MKKKLYDLTIREFTLMLLGMEEKYDFSMKYKNENGEYQEDTIINATYSTLIEAFNHNIVLKKEIEDNYLDYRMDLSLFEAYDYLDFKTHGFETERVKLALDEMECIYDMEYLEDKDEEAISEYIKNNWEIPIKEFPSFDKLSKKFSEKGFEPTKCPDYAKMRNKLFFCEDYTYQRITYLLKDKLGSKIIDSSKEKEKRVLLPRELDLQKAHKYWDRAIKTGFVNKDYSFNGTKYQMALFAECMAEKLVLKHKWKPFIKLWNFDKFSQTRRESRERFGKVDKGAEIEHIFKD